MYNPQLETFLCVVESGSFNKAAEKLYISPPAVIKQINLLEENLDLRLFVRTHRGLVLTEAGKSLYQDAKYIIQYCKDSVTRARNAMQKSDSLIRIGTSPMTPAQVLVDLWPKVQEYCPNIKFQLIPFDNTPENAREILGNLGQNIDVVAGIFDETMLKLRRCEGLEISREPICCAVSIHHRLAKKDRLMAVKYAARDAIEASGAVGLDTEVHEEQPDDETIDTDVVIVGAGMAGISAAIEAKEAGADVIVLEKLDRIGGSAITSGGIVYGTNALMNRDIDNDPEDMVEYYIERGNSNIDVDIVRFWAEHSGESVDWLTEDMGVEFATLGASGTSPAQRAHTTANGGAGIILPMFEQFEALDIELRRDTPVTELIYDGERVTGVVAEHDGATVTIHADAVIVACGGFDASEEAKEL